MKKPLALLAVLTVVLGPLVLAAPASSATSSSGTWRATITFQKNEKNQFDSRVTWRLLQRQAGAWKLVETRSWRAGAGLPGKVGRNSCATSRGWLPNGAYHLRLYDNYRGNKIHGRAFRLDDKACSSGRVRHNLFLHTEQGPGNRQCRNRRGDQACRWEWPRINDYKSYGCIKMAPVDLAQLADLFHRHFSSGVRYATGRVALVVSG